jgi:putative endopeptidase
MKANPIPPEYPTWGSFSQLLDKNQQNLRQILEAAEKQPAAAGSNEQKIGDFYASCMDTTAINAAGTKPIDQELRNIAQMKNEADLQAEAAHLHQEGVGVLFGFRATQDAKDSSQVVGAAWQGGLGLPEREYYLKQDDKSKQVRDAYVKHVAKMFELLGDSADTAATEATTVLGIENSLATASMKNTDLRDPNKTYHRLKMADLQAMTPDFSW